MNCNPNLLPQVKIDSPLPSECTGQTIACKDSGEASTKPSIEHAGLGPVLNTALDPALNLVLSKFVQAMKGSKAANDELPFCVPLQGGYNNGGLFRFEFENLSYVLRRMSSEKGVADRLRELHFSQQAGNIGVGPKIVYVDDKLETYVMTFVEGRTVVASDFDDPKLMSKFAQTLRKLHTSQAKFPKTQSQFCWFQHWLLKGSEQGAIYPTDFQHVRKSMEEIQSILSLFPVPLAPTHHDLNPRNILINENKFTLLDWDRSGLGDPYVDLATFPLMHNFDSNKTRAFLSEYFGRPPTQHEWDRVVVSQPLFWFHLAAWVLSDPAEGKTVEFYDKVLKEGNLATLQDLGLSHEQGLPRQHEMWEYPLIFINWGLDFVRGNEFQSAMQRLHKEAGKVAISTRQK